MNFDERLSAFLSELIDGVISIADIKESDLQQEEKDILLSKYKEHLEAKLLDDPFVGFTDPIDVQGKVRTWGSKTANKFFSPIQDHSLVYFCGKQNSGKTAFTFDMAVKNAKEGIRTLYISLEMTEMSILSRVGRGSACITKELWREKEKIPEHMRTKYRQAINEIRALDNLVLKGFGSGDSPTIEAIEKLIKSIRPDLVFIDNFDLIQNTGVNQLDHERIVSRRLMDFTNQEKVPIVVLHHLKKTKDSGEVDAVRGSGKITDDADAIYFCAREAKADSERDKAIFYIWEKKDREFGEHGYCEMFFNKGTFQDQFAGETQAGF